MIKKPKLLLWIAGLTTIMSLVVIFSFKLNWGIDFTGGTLLELKSSRPDPTKVSEELNRSLGISATVQATGNNTLLVRTAPLSNDQHNKVIKDLTNKKLIDSEAQFETIGPTIGAELRRKAWIAIGLAVIGMIGYLAYEFRQASGLIKPWKFGVAAVLAMCHDLIFVTGAFIVLGKFYGATIDTLFVTALLAILGYSVNDTIIIFNRLKTEWLLARRATLIDVMEKAVQITLTRSLNTSLATLLTLLILLIFGGETIRWFVAALTIGIFVGTYSSIFVAPPLLYLMAKQKR